MWDRWRERCTYPPELDGVSAERMARARGDGERGFSTASFDGEDVGERASNVHGFTYLCYGFPLWEGVWAFW